MTLRLALAVLFLALTTVPAAAQPATFESVFSEGVAARRAGNLAQAIQRLEQAVALRPDSAEALYHLGLAYAFAERYAEAEERLSRAVLSRQNDTAQDQQRHDKKSHRRESQRGDPETEQEVHKALES